MGIATKDIGTIAAKWSQRAQAAGPDYTAGVKAPRNDWAQNTSASAQSWAQGVQQAVTDGRFQSGVTAAGTAKWQTNAVSKGATRYPQGVAGAQTAYQNGFSPYLQVLQNLTLPPRGPKGSPNNNQRVVAVNQALHSKKVGG
jgi:hypothetical protein